MVDPVIAVKTLLLRQAMPELLLRPGASVVARVASRGQANGVLVLAGVPLTAHLPDDVPAGATLRLKVTDVTPQRVTLALDGPPVPAAAAPPAPNRPVRIAVREPPRRRVEAGEPRASVALAFDSPVLGRLDLRIDLTAATVEVTADVPAAVQDPLQQAAPRLRDGLAARTGREAVVRVRPRHDPVDLYA